MIRRAVLFGLFVKPGAGSDIGFAAKDRFDVVLFCGQIELYRGIHVAMVGEGNGFHAQFFCPFYQVLDPAHAVEQAEFRMGMKVYKVVRHNKVIITKKAVKA